MGYILANNKVRRMTSKKKKVEALLKGIPKAEIIKAQKKLDKLCKQHGLKSWKIHASKGRWHQLCLLMLGLKVNIPTPGKEGRSRTPEDKLDDLWGLMVSYSEIEDLNKGTKPLSRKVSYHKVAKESGIEPTVNKTTGRVSKPEDIVRGRFHTANKRRLMADIKSDGEIFRLVAINKK